MSFIKTQGALKEQREEQGSASSKAIGLEKLQKSLSLGNLFVAFSSDRILLPGEMMGRLLLGGTQLLK